MADVKISQLPSIASVNPGNTVAPIVTNGATYQITASNLVYSVLPSLAGQTGKVLGTDGAGLQWVAAGTVSSVNVDGGATGMTFDGGPVTSSGTMTMSGTLNILNGGTGATTRAGAINNLLPSQTGAVNLFLKSDGTNVSWSDAGAGTVTSVDGSGGTTGMTLSGGPITGTGTLTLGGTLAITSGGTGSNTAAGAAAAILPSQSGQNGKVLSTDGATLSWVAVSGGGGTVTSVDVSGGATGLVFSGGPVTLNGTITAGGTLAATHGGTGLNTYTAGDLLYATSSTALGVISAGPNGYVLTMSGGVPAWTAGGGGGSLSGVTQATTPFLTSLGGNANVSATGLENTFIGTNAGKVVTTGANNTVVGADAMAANNGSYNTIVGNNAAVLMTAGNNNTLVGSDIFTVATTGSGNTVVGRQAGKVSTGSDNVFIGYQCADLATTLSNSVLIGAYAGAATTAGSNNMVGVGYAALNNLTSGVRNTAVGNYAVANNQTGGDNTALGDSAGRQATGSNGTYIGSRAGTAVTTGAGNTFVGASSGDVVTTGANNTFVGLNSGGLVTTGGNNTLIGQYQGTTTLQGAVVLSDGAANIRTFINSAGALSFDGTDFGTAGYVLTSSGPTGRPAWAPGGGGTGAVNSVTGAAPIVANPTVGNVQLSIQTDPTFDGNVSVTGNLTTNTAATVIPNTPSLVNSDDPGNPETALVFYEQQSGFVYNGDPDDPSSGYIEYSVEGTYDPSGHLFRTNNFTCAVINENGVGFLTGDTQSNLGTFIKSGTNPATNIQWVLPAAQGAANTVLTNDGAGNLSWAAGGGGSITTPTPTTLGGVYGRMFGDETNWTISLGYKSMGAGTFFGNNATVVGYKSFENTTGNITGWVALGNFIGVNQTVAAGDGSIAIGHFSAQKHQSANSLLAIGYEALRNVNNANPGTAIGYQAGKNLTTGEHNTFIGWKSGTAATTGSFNTGVANIALQSLSTGSRNTVFGYGAGLGITTASGNTLIGHSAGSSVLLGANNTMVGSYIGDTSANFSGYVVLSNGTADVRFMANYYGAWSPDGTNFGTNGQVLTSQGPNLPPIWAAGGGGGATPATPTAEGTVFGFTRIDSNNTAFGWGAGDSVTGDKNTFVGRQTGNNVGAGTTNTIVGRFTGTQGLTGHVILADGDGSIRFSSNMGAAVSFDGTTYGNNGQFLMSRGDAQRPIWQDVPATIPATPLAAGVVYALTNQGSGIGNNNACLGYQAGDNMTGSACVAIGLGAGQNSNAGLAVAVGNGALKNALGGAQGCVAIGFNSMSAGMNAPNNVAIGNGAMAAGTSVLGIAIGFQAAAAMTTAQGFVAIGGGSLKVATTNALSVGATAVGYDTFPVATQPANSTAFGYRSGWKTTTGQNNTFIGNLAGSEVTTGGSNTLVGRWAGTTTTEGVVALSDGAGNIRAYINNAGALSFDGTNFGTVGQVLGSGGNAAPPTWLNAGGVPPATPTVAGTVFGRTSGTILTPVLLGFQAGNQLPSNTTTGTVVIGTRALSSWTNATGPYGVYIGGDAGMMQTAGEANTFIGLSTGSGSTTYNHNTVVGYNCMTANGTGVQPQQNSVFGALAGQSLRGNANILIGYNVCRQNTTDYNNAVIIGSNFTASGKLAADLDGHVIITKGDGTVRLDINSAGAVSFNSTNYGVNGQVLVSQGSTGQPVWANAPLPTQYTFSTLPTTGAALGMQGVLTDGQAGLNWGDAPVGGGTTKYLVWFNGTRWSVMGK